MSWNPDNQTVTLLAENHGTAKHPRLKLIGMVRRTTPEGDTYLESFSDAWGIDNLVFDTLEVNPPYTMKRGADAGELSLQGTNTAVPFGGRKA